RHVPCDRRVVRRDARAWPLLGIARLGTALRAAPELHACLRSRDRLGQRNVHASGELRLRPVRRLVLLAVLALAAPLVADDRTVETRRLLELLAGVRLAYLEAFEDRGAELESLTELEEARLRLAEARQLNGRLHVLPDEEL